MAAWGQFPETPFFTRNPKRAVSLLQLGYCCLSGFGDRFRFVKKSVRSRIVIQQLAEARQGLSSLEFNESVCRSLLAEQRISLLEIDRKGPWCG
jgi:hypothetical protein